MESCVAGDVKRCRGAYVLGFRVVLCVVGGAGGEVVVLEKERKNVIQ
jgi:hypothetical protein